jgi:hypothetical protein
MPIDTDRRLSLGSNNTSAVSNPASADHQPAPPPLPASVQSGDAPWHTLDKSPQATHAYDPTVTYRRGDTVEINHNIYTLVTAPGNGTVRGIAPEGGSAPWGAANPWWLSGRLKTAPDGTAVPSTTSPELLVPESIQTTPNDQTSAEESKRSPSAPFASMEDAEAFQRISSHFASLALPDPRKIAKDMIHAALHEDGEQLVVAHFKGEESRRRGLADSTMSLTDAVTSSFPGFAHRGSMYEALQTLGGLFSGGSSPTPAGFIDDLFSSQSAWDASKTIFNFLGSRTALGYLYNVFFAEGNVPDTIDETRKSIDQSFGIYRAPFKSLGSADDTHKNVPYSKPASAVFERFKSDTWFGELPYVKKLHADIDRYWQQNKTDWTIAARYRFIEQVRHARDDHTLTPTDYAAVTREAAPGMPLDGPITLAQLRRSQPSSLHSRTMPLQINGYAATDIVRFPTEDGGQVMYVPGQPKPFIKFPDTTALFRWLAGQGKSAEKREALLSHFSLRDRQHGSTRPGVEQGLDRIAETAPMGKAVTTITINDDDEVITTVRYKYPPGAQKLIDSLAKPQSAIEGDVFEHVRHQTEKRLRDDADIQSRSAWEGWRDTLDQWSVVAGPFAALPQLGTGIDRAAHGDTSAERAQGNTQIADAAIAIAATAASIGAAKGAAVPSKQGAAGSGVRKNPSNNDPVQQSRIKDTDTNAPDPSSPSARPSSTVTSKRPSSAEQNRAIAQSVYEEVKAAYRKGLKSNNKFRPVVDDMMRKLDASDTLKRIRETYKHNLDHGIIVPPQPGELVIPAANCGELARIAARRAIEKGGYAEVWDFGPLTDHEFTVIGRPARTGNPPVQETTSTTFANWQDAWIVDPWANISCPAPQYIGQLTAKMAKWQEANKKIQFGSEVLEPTHSAWVNAIRFSEKRKIEAPSDSQPNPWASYPIDFVPSN